MSNSGKPFFVFWSLLAVPTLTILISNMGDTVIKGVKDLTIWLGEITFLPSTDTSTIERIKIGVHHLTMGSVTFEKAKLDDEQQRENTENLDKDWAGFRDSHPGLIQMFDHTDSKKVDRNDLQTLSRLTKTWEAAEPEDEDLARERNHAKALGRFDERNPDDLLTCVIAAHHYRHLLVSHIPRIYADTKLTQSKKYSYAEWAFYLRLLGEDESNSSRHIRARPVYRERHRNTARQDGVAFPDNSGANDKDARSAGPDENSPKWSWIGRMSPLMHEKDEAEWILERLFNRLEESLREVTKSHPLQSEPQEYETSDHH